MPDELVVRDPTVVEMLFDPLRYRLFRLLDEPRTVTELAAEVGVPANRLYYHVRRLVQSGIVKQVDARPVAKGTERVYRAERISFSGELRFRGPLAEVMSEVEGALSAYAGEPEEESPAHVIYHVQRLTPKRAQELDRRIGELVSEYTRARRPAKDARSFAILAAVTPLPHGK